MELKNCDCGRPVRLGAYKIKIGGKHGVSNYIAHSDGSLFCLDGFECSAMKPYPKDEKDKESFKLCERWNNRKYINEGE